MIDIPRDFLLGCATSSHQVEGGNANNDWWDWEQKPGAIHDGARSGDACGWWAGRAEDDLALAAARQQNAHRLSLEWSRLEPEQGRFDDGAFARYAEILRAARELGMHAMVTIHHFTLPRWVAARGGFEWSGVVPAFERYAREVARRLTPDTFATLNEPNVQAFMAYITHEWPPGRSSMLAGVRAFGHMMRAHAAAYRAMRPNTKAPIGIVINLPSFEPYSHKLRDRAITRVQEWSFSGAMLEALARGRLWPPVGRGERVPELVRSYDFIGLNYYGRYRVFFDPRASARGFGRADDTHTVHTRTNDWGEIHPEGLTRHLLTLSEFGVPLYVTENGVYDPTDELRPRVLRDHIAAALEARARGADVRGYFHWSLVDNFEWAQGWSTPFGLFAVDPKTQARTPRPSASLFEQICRARKLDSVLPKTVASA